MNKVMASFVGVALIISITIVQPASSLEKSLVEWMEYSEETFKYARNNNKPIFMLVTAAWCFWCTVYETNSLESADVAYYLNNNYVNVFVDFDKRKDIVAGRFSPTGLPYTVILSPTDEPLASRPGYIEKKTLLENLKKTAEYVKTKYKPSTIDEAGQVANKLDFVPTDNDNLDTALLLMQAIVTNNYDKEYGGFGDREKKAHGGSISFLLELYKDTNEQKWLDMATKSLDYVGGAIKAGERSDAKPALSYLIKLHSDREAKGWVKKIGLLQREDKIYGLFDTVDGGFFRYSLQKDWSLPHFEKMLQENAELIEAYLKAYEITGNTRYKELAGAALDYAMNTLYDKLGYFYGSQAADGVYYHLNSSERKLVSPPSIDKTGYSASNALMLIAMLDAWQTLNDTKYKEVAVKVFDFFIKNMITSEGMLSYYNHKSKKGELDGQLVDNAIFALALLKGYRTLGDLNLLEQAERILKFMQSNLHDSSGGGFVGRKSTSKKYYRTGDHVSTNKPYVGNGIAAYTLLMAHSATGEKEYLQTAKETTGLFLAEYPNASKPWFQRVCIKLKKLNYEERNSLNEN
ncbi:MAG TPA: DUF255 domain-containing protein [Nitrospinota bacterium]|nr:DUF255 domain-containing protein [Nitrospinota bacterium]|tara:strand:- start:43049 stop:44776 length:1728 start_codon:yes stop_codon:yes gene_type:complete